MPRVTHAAVMSVVCLLAGGCGKTDTADAKKAPVVEPIDDDDEGTAGTETAVGRSDPRPPAPVVTTPGTTPAATPALDSTVQQIAEGTSCTGYGDQITDASSTGEFARKGDVWSRSEFWGCGCPRGPEFTLVYEPGTSPLVIRLCHDEAKDACEAGCRQTLSWDLGSALQGAKASDVAFAAR